MMAGTHYQIENAYVSFYFSLLFCGSPCVDGHAARFTVIITDEKREETESVGYVGFRVGVLFFSPRY